jgi:hypothetical protein
MQRQGVGGEEYMQANRKICEATSGSATGVERKDVKVLSTGAATHPSNCKYYFHRSSAVGGCSCETKFYIFLLP